MGKNPDAVGVGVKRDLLKGAGRNQSRVQAKSRDHQRGNTGAESRETRKSNKHITPKQEDKTKI